MTSSWTLILVAVCLLLFSSLNLHNVLHYRGRSAARVTKPEVQGPHSLIVGLAALGTGVLFLESLLYLFFGVFRDLAFTWTIFDLAMMRNDLLELVGASVMVSGYAIFIWSVIARGQYATSWAMSQKQRLVDWGPYRYVRHPSYLGYFLMFAGFFIMSHNILTLIPFIAIPGYILVTFREEEMLLRRFGEEYTQYKKKVGRFLPKMRLQESR